MKVLFSHLFLVITFLFETSDSVKHGLLLMSCACVSVHARACAHVYVHAYISVSVRLSPRIYSLQSNTLLVKLFKACVCSCVLVEVDSSLDAQISM